MMAFVPLDVSRYLAGAPDISNLSNVSNPSPSPDAERHAPGAEPWDAATAEAIGMAMQARLSAAWDEPGSGLCPLGGPAMDAAYDAINTAILAHDLAGVRQACAEYETLALRRLAAWRAGSPTLRQVARLRALAEALEDVGRPDEAAQCAQQAEALLATENG